MENKEKKINLISLGYYAKKEIKEAIYEFCKKRETVPRYGDFFGKRPDILDYPNDVYMLAKKGATSFHCSQEIWKNPLDIRTEMKPDEYNEIREGWDLLIDIDSKYLDYSKIAAKLIVQALEFKEIKNFGIKFSGSKGFHIIVPWGSFPEKIDEIETKNMFPEWARAISSYLSKLIEKKLNEELTKITPHETTKEVIYKPTEEIAEEKKIYYCNCKNCETKAEFIMPKKNKKRIFKCGVCGGEMEKMKEESVYVSSNGDNSKKNPEKFEEKIKTSGIIDSVDLVLVSPRHLFRTPYSLHEKTGLVSQVINKNEIDGFEPKMAEPTNIEIKNFYPECKKNEARRLLMEALDWMEKNEKREISEEKREIDLSGIKIDESFFPPTILKILGGIKNDGRKRALTILLSFFSSMNLPKEYIETKIYEWNKKNYQPLKESYINSQINWFLRNKRLPPNYDKQIYKELGVYQGEKGIKNPLSYSIKKIMEEKKKIKLKNGKINK